MNSAGFSHQSVLLDEAIAAMALKPGMTAVDATAGGGGHSREMARALGSSGRLICLDQDPDAVCVLQERLGGYPQVTVVQENFSAMDTVLDGLGITSVNAVLMDLGVSSHQLDTGARGFSYQQDSPLDMRMSKTGMSAAEVVNTY
ncbi:MAG: 16S rRNA (cytosine(1402)-N(4))-methyltransferase, partial [Clostridiales bacterium]|nr:16S rRNA (cytosine(1402)-N(4))-methyltransferase [Clostridiales bacterium]